MLSLSAYCKEIEESCSDLVAIVRSRPYRMPKGYISWQRLSPIIAVHMMLVREGEQYLIREDLPTRITAFKIAQWFLQDVPMYCLSIGLLRAFEKADLSNLYELFEGFETKWPTFLIALPENALRTAEGATISFLCVHIASEDHPELSTAEGYGITIPYLEHDGWQNVHISTIDSHCSTWVSGLTVNRRGKLYDSGAILGTQALDSAELSDADRMKKIGLQCLLALAYSPELLEAEVIGSIGRTSKRHQRREKRSVRQPRWLRSPASKPTPRPPQGGSHASPRPHWRSPHKRRVPVGPREQGGRKVVQIAPTWVNPGSD